MSFSGTARTCPFGQHRHRLDPGQGPASRLEAPEAEHGSGQALDPAVVLLDPVVQPAPAPVPRETPELAVPLHLPQRAGITLEPVGDDDPRIAGVPSAECPAEKALGLPSKVLLAMASSEFSTIAARSAFAKFCGRIGCLAMISLLLGLRLVEHDGSQPAAILVNPLPASTIRHCSGAFGLPFFPYQTGGT